MNAVLEPADYTVSELHDAIDDLDDPEALSVLLEVEADGENRKTAKEAIEERLETLQDEPPSSDGVDEPEVTAEDDPDASEEDPTAEPDAPAAPDDSTGTPPEADLTALGLAIPEEAELPADEPTPEPDLNQHLVSNLVRIRTLLEDASGRGGSVEARLDELQAEVSDLKAYTNALEEFLDEEGTGQQIVESVRRDLVAITDEVEHLELVLARHDRSLDGHDEQLETLQSEVATLADDLEAHRETATDWFGTIEEALDEHAATHDDLGEQLDSVQTEAADIASAVDALEADLEEGLAAEADDRAALERQVDTLVEETDALKTSIDETAENVAALEETLGSVSQVDQRFAAIEAELEELTEWREQLGSAMVGGGAQ